MTTQTDTKQQRAAGLRAEIAEGLAQWRQTNRRAREMFVEYTALMSKAGGQYREIMKKRAELEWLEKDTERT